MFAGSSGGGMSNKGSVTLENRLAREIKGDVFFDAFNRGRYATDASFYQIVPLGVVVPGPWTRHFVRSPSSGMRAGSSPPRRRHLAVRPDRQ